MNSLIGVKTGKPHTPGSPCQELTPRRATRVPETLTAVLFSPHQTIRQTKTEGKPKIPQQGDGYMSYSYDTAIQWNTAENLKLIN